MIGMQNEQALNIIDKTLASMIDLANEVDV